MYNDVYPQVLLVTFIWLISCIYYSRKKDCYSVSLVNNFVLWTVITSFCIFYAYSYDYYSYERRFEEFLMGYEQDYLEQFYMYLMSLSQGNYLIWRLFVWGGASLFIILTCRRLKISSYYFGAIFLSLTLVHAYYYLRNSLAFALFFWGLSFFYVTNNKRILSYIVGISGVFFSLFLHKSMPFYLFVTLICFMLPFNKRIIRISLCCFPILYVFVSVFVSIFLNLDIFNDSIIQERGMEYVESDYSQNLTIFGYLQMVIIRFPVLLCLYYSIKNIYVLKTKVHPVFEFYLKYSYVMIYISLLFVGQGMSEHISLRFWNAALIPFSFFMSSFLFNRQKFFFPKVIYRLTVFSTMYVLLYNLYTFYS